MHSWCDGFGWKLSAATVRGAAHERLGLPCQDAYALRCDNGAVAAVVCDGAGSAPLSQFGAEAVSAALARHFCSKTQEPVELSRLIELASRAISESVGCHGGEARDYACTVQGVCIRDDIATSFHLGDGLVAAGVAGETRVLHAPQRGEFANSTYLLPSPTVRESMAVRQHSLTGLTRTFAMITDGLLPVFFSAKTGEASQVLEQMGAWLDEADSDHVARELEETIVSRLRARTSDDCTLVLLRRMVSAGELLPPICTECARWVTSGTKHHFTINYVCDGCRHEFSRGRFPALSRWLPGRRK